MKKVFGLLIFIFMFIGLPNVKASTFYTNSSGVDFTEEEYEYISEMYFDGYQEYMTQEDLDKMVELDLIGKPITKQTSNSGIIGSNIVGTRNYDSSYYAGRTISISSSCASQCLVTLKAQWSGTPTIQSWDTIGFRVLNVTINTINGAMVTGTGYSVAYGPASTSFQQFSTGFGYSVKLGNANNLKITTSMYTEPGGTVYGSYQHATVNTSLATSKLYTIALGGYGSVFMFYGNAFGIYDGAPGVYITVA